MPPDESLEARARAWLLRRARTSTSKKVHGAIERGQAIAELMSGLYADDELLAGTLLYPMAQIGRLDREDLDALLGSSVGTLVDGLIRLGSFHLPANWEPQLGLPREQAENLRQMLLAFAADVRLVLVRLSEQLHDLRQAKSATEADRHQLALETREIFAPLANRLGIWQLKWELEDLAFRYLEPEVYHRIARSLAESRSDREAFIDEVKETLRTELGKQNVSSDISGRPKHIYSISRKMRRKGVEFEEIFDVRAVRILVDTIADCYAALGVVHGLWHYIPGEFDDYIATPKENMYRSLHTAVTGPGGKALEVQIRTREMHEHAELGVAAHWQYKEGGKRDAAFEQKINWLRQLLEPEDKDESTGDFIDRVRAEIFEDRVYVISPRGDVVDLPQGATPLDFAYHVHTEVGHHCRGAKVNGRMVPMTYQLGNGEQVEIITAKNSTPSRDWLIPQFGYLASPRSRSKVRAWFRHQDKEQNRRQGRVMLDKELARLGIKELPTQRLLRSLRLKTMEDLYGALGMGDVTLAAVTQALSRQPGPAPEPLRGPRRGPHPDRPPRGAARTQITVEGIGDLMSQFARCCRPVPPEPIAGYITLGRGVSIHRQDCSNLLRLQETHHERIIEASWSEGSKATYPVDIRVEAYDRQGLTRDVSSVFADAKVSILEMELRTDAVHNTAHLDLRVAVEGLDQLSRLLNRLSILPNVVAASRKT